MIIIRKVINKNKIILSLLRLHFFIIDTSKKKKKKKKKKKDNCISKKRRGLVYFETERT